MQHGKRESDVQGLVEAIRYHQDKYYNGHAEISDAEFDMLWDSLKALDPSNDIFKRVGKDASEGFEKAKHIIPMGSQDKASSPEAFGVWYLKCRRDKYLAQCKLDGSSIELQYINGEFVRAVTRGNGAIGDDVTSNISRAKGVCKKLPDFRFTGGVRGEVLLFHDIFKTKYSDKANCRNAANGLMKRKDGVGSEDLAVMCYDAMSSIRQDHFSDELEKIAWLTSQGFNVVPSVVLTKFDDIVSYRDRMNEIRKTELQYDIDGLVIKCPEIDLEDARKVRPEHQIAFKFSLDEEITTLREVEWSASGRTRTPIAICDPVQLAGTTVQRANLCNPGLINSLKIKIGSKVVMVKRGEIIPKIERVLETPADATDIPIPTMCECCGTKLVCTTGSLICPNETCDLTLEHRISKWVETVGIKHLGPNTIHALYVTGLVKNIYALYHIRVADISPIVGEKNAAKIIREISAHHDVTLPQLIAGQDFDGIGETVIELLQKAGFVTLDDIVSADIQALCSVKGIGSITAKQLKDKLSESALRLVTLTDSVGPLNLQYPSTDKLPLTGISFCFTGEMVSMKRSEAMANVRNLGGDVVDSVRKGLSFLVTNDPESGSSKNLKAKQFGVPIIDESTFITMIQNAK